MRMSGGEEEVKEEEEEEIEFVFEEQLGMDEEAVGNIPIDMDLDVDDDILPQLVA